MSRCLLHKTKLQDLKNWLDSQKIPHRPGRGDYQILQIQVNENDWYVIYSRASAVEHYTVDYRLEPMIRRFIGETS